MRTFQPNGFQYVRDAQSRNLPSKDGLLPGRLHEGLRRQIIYLVRLHVPQRADEAREIEKISIDDFDIAIDAQPLQPSIADICVT